MPRGRPRIELVTVDDLVDDDVLMQQGGVFAAIDAIDELAASRTMWLRLGGGARKAITKRRTTAVTIVTRDDRHKAGAFVDEPQAPAPEVPVRVGSGDELVHVEQLHSFVNEGHVYRSGEQHFLIYTGESGQVWDVCLTSRSDPVWPFERQLFSASGRDDAVAQLRVLLDQGALSAPGG